MIAPRSSFRLSGPSTALDPRVDAVRADLADVGLADRLFAPHYAEPVETSCLATTPVFDKPDGKQISELLVSEHFCLLDQSGGWAWGWCAHDHYVGYVPADKLGAAQAVVPANVSGDAVAAAKAFLDMPYVWGGRGGAGIDCSGLVQRALAAIGMSAPRDSDMQHAALGRPLTAGESLKAGDLVFFPGHVGMMADDVTLIHATQFHSKTVLEPLADVVERATAKFGSGIVARKRTG
jgi:cell wall-associated NlpC family hydrolase